MTTRHNSYNPVAQRRRAHIEKTPISSSSSLCDASWNTAEYPSLIRSAPIVMEPQRERCRKRRGNLTKRQQQQPRGCRTGTVQRPLWDDSTIIKPQVKLTRPRACPASRTKKAPMRGNALTKSKPPLKRTVEDSARKVKVGGSINNCSANKATEGLGTTTSCSAVNLSNNKKDSDCTTFNRCAMINRGHSSSGCRRKQKNVAFQGHDTGCPHVCCSRGNQQGDLQPIRNAKPPTATTKKTVGLGGNKCQTCNRSRCRQSGSGVSQRPMQQCSVCSCTRGCPRSQSAPRWSTSKNAPVSSKSDDLMCSCHSAPCLQRSSVRFGNGENRTMDVFNPTETPHQFDWKSQQTLHHHLPDSSARKCQYDPKLKGGIIKKSPSKFYTSSDTLDFCSRAMSSMRIKEDELLEKYGPSSLEVQKKCCNTSPMYGITNTMLPRFDREPRLAWDQRSGLKTGSALNFPHQGQDWQRKQRSSQPLWARTRNFSNNRFANRSTYAIGDTGGSTSWFSPYRTVCNSKNYARPRSAGMSLLQPRPYDTVSFPKAELRLLSKYLQEDGAEMMAVKSKMKSSTPDRNKTSESGLEVSNCQSKGEGTARPLTPPWRKVEGASGCPGFVLDSPQTGTSSPASRPLSGRPPKFLSNWRWGGADSTVGVTETPRSDRVTSNAGARTSGLGETTSDSRGGVSSKIRANTESGVCNIKMSGSIGPSGVCPISSSGASGGGGANILGEWQVTPSAKTTPMDSCFKEEEDRLRRVGSIIG